MGDRRLIESDSRYQVIDISVSDVRASFFVICVTLAIQWPPRNHNIRCTTIVLDAITNRGVHFTKMVFLVGVPLRVLVCIKKPDFAFG